MNTFFSSEPQSSKLGMYPTEGYECHDAPFTCLATAIGPTKVVLSSAALQWRGVLIEKHSSAPGRRRAASLDRPVITRQCLKPARVTLMPVGQPPTRCLGRPGLLTIMPAGPIPAAELHTAAESVCCAFDQDFLAGVASEVCAGSASRPEFRMNVSEPSMERILTLMVEELKVNGKSGRLYMDSLAYALATRYLLFGSVPLRQVHLKASGLPARILKRVHEKIESHLEDDLSLESLAKESGYSPAHFLRMFRAATGLTPHQYVLELRLRRAQACLRQGRSSIVDVSLACGFSSQSHMTSVFRKRFEMTPAQFRRTSRGVVACAGAC